MGQSWQLVIAIDGEGWWFANLWLTLGLTTLILVILVLGFAAINNSVCLEFSVQSHRYVFLSILLSLHWVGSHDLCSSDLMTLLLAGMFFAPFRLKHLRGTIHGHFSLLLRGDGEILSPYNILTIRFMWLKIFFGHLSLYLSTCQVLQEQSWHLYTFEYFTRGAIDGVQVRLMLVLAPAACIMAGIALSAAFDTLTGSIKFQPISPSPSPVPSEKVTLPIQHRAHFHWHFSGSFLKVTFPC